MKNMRVETTVEITNNQVVSNSRIASKHDKWTPVQRGMLMLMVDKHMSWEEIGAELKRSPTSCRSMYAHLKSRIKISDLEAKVSRLESTNEMYRQLAEINEEMIANLEEELKGAQA